MQDRATVQQTQKKPVKGAFLCRAQAWSELLSSHSVYRFFTLQGGIGEGTPAPATPLPTLEMLQPSVLSWVSIFIFRDKLCPGINYV